MDLEIEALGKLVASAKNAKRYRVVIASRSAGLTAKTLEGNPGWSGNGLLYAEELPDAGGKAEFDLSRRRDELEKQVKALKLKVGADLDAFVVGYPADGAHSVSAGPALKLKRDVIPIGSAIAPPRPWDAKKEREWFMKLEETSWEELEPGDVCIRKAYAGSFVADAQERFNAAKGSKFSTHVMIYTGGRKVAHAYEGTMSAEISDPPPHHVVVYRATDKAQARSAAEVARWLATLGIEYSMIDCMRAGVESSSWGPDARERAAKVAARQKPLSRCMCSCFATLCYQGTRDAYVQLDAKHVAPVRLEDYVNSNPGKFRFAGAIRGTVEGSTMSNEQLIKLGILNVAGEIADHVERAGDKVGGAVEKVADKVVDKGKEVADKVGDKLKNLF
jgi:hypothetical protein